MDKELILKTLQESTLPEPAQKRLGEREFKDDTELRTVIESEVAYLKEAATPLAPVVLSEAEVKAAVKSLPTAAQKRLGEAQYKDRDELSAAVTAEIAYLKEVSGSGKPLVPQSQSQSQPVSLEERNKAKDDVIESYFGGRPAVTPLKGA